MISIAKTKKDILPSLLAYVLLGSVVLAVISHYLGFELQTATYKELKNVFFVPLKIWIYPVISIAMFGIFFRNPDEKASKFFILFADIIVLYLVSTLIANIYAFFSFSLFPFAEFIMPLMNGTQETVFNKTVPEGVPPVIIVIAVALLSSFICRYILIGIFAKLAKIICSIFCKILACDSLDRFELIKSLKDEQKNSSDKMAQSLTLVNFVEKVIFSILTLILFLAPIAVFSSFLEILNVRGMHFFLDLGKFIASYASILLSYQFLVLPLVRSIFCFGIKGETYGSFLTKALPVIATAGTTASSAATLSTNIKAAQSLTVPKDMEHKGHNRALMPIGATFNMDGTSISLVIYFLLAANLAGMSVGFWPVVTAAVLLSVGTAAVPSASLIMLTSMYSTFSVPAAITGKLLSIIIAIDPIHDRLRTIVNTWGDLNVVYIVQSKRGMLSMILRLVSKKHREKHERINDQV